MEYLLVLQWSSDSSTQDYDQLIEIEELLMEKLSDNEEVDGHDIGSGEMNIFIYTDDPAESFQRVKTILENHKMWPPIRIAYRELTSDAFTILWPQNLTHFQVT